MNIKQEKLKTGDKQEESHFSVEERDFYIRRSKTADFFTFPIIVFMCLYSIIQLTDIRSKIHMIANLYYLATTIVSSILYYLAYYKKKHYLILPAYMLNALLVVVKMLDFEDNESLMECKEWVRH